MQIQIQMLNVSLFNIKACYLEQSWINKNWSQNLTLRVIGGLPSKKGSCNQLLM